MRLRRLIFGLLTLFGFARRGYFIPYRYAETADASRHLGAYAEIGARLRAQEPGFAEILARIAHYAPDLSAIGEDEPPAPRWNQDWFARLDAAIAYVLVRDLSPIE